MAELSQYTLGLVRQALESLLPDTAYTPHDVKQFWKAKLFDAGFAPLFTDLASSGYSFDWTEIIPDLFMNRFGDRNSHFGKMSPPWFCQNNLNRLLRLALTSSKNQALVASIRQSLADDRFGDSNLSEQHKDFASMIEIEIFISHSSQDKLIADALTDLLKNALPVDPQAIRCTSVEGHKLPVGSRTGDRLREELLNAKCFIALLTPHSLSSTWVLFELGARWGRDHHLAPIIAAGLTPGQLGGPLPDINALSCDSDADLHQLVQDIADVLGIKPRNAALYTRNLGSLRELSRSQIQHSDRNSRHSSAEIQPGNKHELKLKSFGDVHYFVREGEEIPYCPACYGTKNHLIPLPAGQNWSGGFRRQCPACKNFFYEKPMSQRADPPRGGGSPWS